ncbi:RHS repeat-associated core domain-containing protein, partial [Leptospira wolffii]
SQELDRETNFYFYNARYYDPQIGRFTSADTMIDGARSTQGWNRFSYVAGNPIRYKDPTGHLAITKSGAIHLDKTSDTLASAAKLGGYSSWNEAANVLGIRDRYTNTGKWKQGSKPIVGITLKLKQFPPPRMKTGPAINIRGTRTFSDRLTRFSQRVSFIAKTTYDWAMAKGEEDRIITDPVITDALRDAPNTIKARDYFYKKYKDQRDLRGASVTDYDGKFGLKGLLDAGMDPVEQFIGNYKTDIYSNGKELIFKQTNITSVQSLLYDKGPNWKRDDPAGPYGGNMKQTYIWKEAIDYSAK